MKRRIDSGVQLTSIGSGVGDCSVERARVGHSGVAREAPDPLAHRHQALLVDELGRGRGHWLACGAPIVEAVGPEVQAPEALGSVGYQYPSCEAPAELNLDSLLAGPLATCSACHPGLWQPDFSSPDAVRETVLSVPDIACNDKPFVTPGEPEASYLYDLVALDEPACHERMPQGGPYLTESELELVAQWIREGTP